MLTILSTNTRQSTSPFNAPNPDRNSFKHFIEHLVGMREIPKSKHKKGRLRFKQDQTPILGAKHSQRSLL